MTIEWLTIIVDNVFGYVLEQSGIGEYVRDKLKRDPAKKAFKRALGKAFERFKQKYPQQVADLFDADFLKKEGAPIISELLVRDGHPNPTELAARWAASLNHRYAEQAGHSTTLIRDMEPAAADL